MARCGSVMQLPFLYRSINHASDDYVKVYYQTTLSEDSYREYRNNAATFYGIKLDDFDYTDNWPFVGMSPSVYEIVSNVFRATGRMAPEKDNFHMVDMFVFLLLIVQSIYPDFEFKEADDQIDGHKFKYGNKNEQFSNS